MAIFKREEGQGHKDEDRREEGLAGVSLFIMHSRLLKIVLVSIPMLLSGFEVPEPNFLLDINGINVGAETDHICVLEEKLGEDIGGKPVCYGSLDESGRMEPPEDALFVQVVTGKHYGCGINLDQTATCWGVMSKPEGLFSQLTGEDFYMCGLRIDSSVVCYGSVPFNELPTGIKFKQIACSSAHCCGIDDLAVPHCWGASEKTCPYVVPPTTANVTSVSELLDLDLTEDDMYADEEDAPASKTDRVKVQMRQLSVTNDWSCGVSLAGKNLYCWGHKGIHRVAPERFPPKFLAGPFKQVAAGRMGVCALRESKDKGGDKAAGGGPGDSIVCWGFADAAIPTDEKLLSWDQLSIGDLLACGVSMQSELQCWGINSAIVGSLGLPDGLIVA